MPLRNRNYTAMEDEITLWMNQLADESPEAAEKIWSHYFDKLVQYAGRKLGSAPRRDADEEDIALSAMHSLHRGVRAGRFPQFNSRDDLWKILLTITSNKAKQRIRHQMTQKRGAGEVRGESVFMTVDRTSMGIVEHAIQEPTPEFAEAVTLECEDLLNQLGDQMLREIALLKLQGYSNQEIADKQDCAVRSVERKLNRIRAIWNDA